MSIAFNCFILCHPSKIYCQMRYLLVMGLSHVQVPTNWHGHNKCCLLGLYCFVQVIHTHTFTYTQYHKTRASKSTNCWVAQVHRRKKIPCCLCFFFSHNSSLAAFHWSYWSVESWIKPYFAFLFEYDRWHHCWCLVWNPALNFYCFNPKLKVALC